MKVCFTTELLSFSTKIFFTLRHQNLSCALWFFCASVDGWKLLQNIAFKSNVLFLWMRPNVWSPSKHSDAPATSSENVDRTDHTTGRDKMTSQDKAQGDEITAFRQGAGGWHHKIEAVGGRHLTTGHERKTQDDRRWRHTTDRYRRQWSSLEQSASGESVALQTSARAKAVARLHRPYTSDLTNQVCLLIN